MNEVMEHGSDVKSNAIKFSTVLDIVFIRACNLIVCLLKFRTVINVFNKNVELYSTGIKFVEWYS